MQLLLDTRGLTLRQRNRCFLVGTDTDERLISPERLTSIAVTQPCLISSAAIRLAVEHGIPVYFFDALGQPQASLRSPYFGALAALRRQQVYFADSPLATAWVAEVFALKCTQQAELLRWLSNRRPSADEALLPALAALAEAAVDWLPAGCRDQPPPAVRATLMGREGSLARQYWQAVVAALPQALGFEARNRRPALDPFNAALNYLYGMLYTTVESALVSAGLDPFLGLFHADEHNAPTLAFDLIEPFRPWADRLLIEAVLDGEWSDDYVDTSAGEGCRLNRAGKHWLIPRWNAYLQQREPFHTYQTTRQSSVYRYAAELRQRIEGFDISR